MSLILLGRSWYNLYHDHIVSTLDGTTDDMLFYVKCPSSAVRPYSTSSSSGLPSATPGDPREGQVEKVLEIFRVEDAKRPDFRDRCLVKFRFFNNNCTRQTLLYFNAVD